MGLPAGASPPALQPEEAPPTEPVAPAGPALEASGPAEVRAEEQELSPHQRFWAEPDLPPPPIPEGDPDWDAVLGGPSEQALPPYEPTERGDILPPEDHVVDFGVEYARESVPAPLSEVAAAQAPFWSTPDDRSAATRPEEMALALGSPEPRGRPGKQRGRDPRAALRPSTPPIEIPVIEAEPNPIMRRIFRRLTRQFGLQGFRPGQERAIRDLVMGRDVLGVMPTGAGKSLIYQLPAFELEGVTVVVSPLLALMRDQEQKLRRTGVVAARLDSTLTTKQTEKTLEDIEEGKRKIIYVTPERVASGNLVEELGGQKVSLFVIDEAHCVSEWGHDFRPSYLSLRRACEQLGRPVMCALTATATPKVQQDIIEQLGLRDPDLIHHGFDRPSLCFEVRETSDEKAQVKRLLRLIRKIHGSVIVYCSTIRTVEALAGALPVLGLKVGMYHGKMGKAERDAAQLAFMRGNPRIMVATNAFGLGVDKPDIRAVIHYNLPGSLESYYQEAGRAGRDGRPSRCILLYNPQDEQVQQYFVAGKYPTRADVLAVWGAVRSGADNLREVALAAAVSQSKSRVVLGILKELELVQELPGPRFVPTGKETDELALGRAAESYRRRREGDRDRLKAMISYARSTRCRVQLLLEYFGEKAELCRRCDNCLNYGDDAAFERAEELRPPTEVPDEDEPPVVERPRVDVADRPALPRPPRKDSIFF
ncbi:MAG: RecQ family ATP-dependent DNA helicase [Myxococcales bacterium]|nr:RecQ family ATP-dependent DNA helicase [Myxococcota bacterium]MDW8282905.1 RecQ family ATP-dependent DNA helicase [Myxococcales bacterium]